MAKKLLLSIFLFISLAVNAKSVKEIYSASKDSVIYLYHEEIIENQKALHFGTGFIISENGLCLTNAHLLNKLIKARDEQGHEIKVLSVEKVDKKNDLALLKLQGSFKPLPIAKEPLEVGDELVVISNSANFQNSLSIGIVSGLRSIEDSSKFQFTAPIAQGSSGGPVFNKDGEVIGLVVGLYDKLNAQNINFGIPSSVVQSFLK